MFMQLNSKPEITRLNPPNSTCPIQSTLAPLIQNQSQIFSPMPWSGISHSCRLDDFLLSGINHESLSCLQLIQSTAAWLLTSVNRWHRIVTHTLAPLPPTFHNWVWRFYWSLLMSQATQQNFWPLIYAIMCFCCSVLVLCVCALLLLLNNI